MKTGCALVLFLIVGWFVWQRHRDPIDGVIQWKTRIVQKIERCCRNNGTTVRDCILTYVQGKKKISNIIWVIDDSETGFIDAWLRALVFYDDSTFQEFHFRYDNGRVFVESEETAHCFPFLESGWSLPAE